MRATKYRAVFFQGGVNGQGLGCEIYLHTLSFLLRYLRRLRGNSRSDLIGMNVRFGSKAAVGLTEMNDRFGGKADIRFRTFPFAAVPPIEDSLTSSSARFAWTRFGYWRGSRQKFGHRFCRGKLWVLLSVRRGACRPYPFHSSLGACISPLFATVNSLPDYDTATPM
jgi:hypothetical protein